MSIVPLLLTTGLTSAPGTGGGYGPELWDNPTPTITDFGGSSGAYVSGTQTMTNTGTGSNGSYPQFTFNLGLEATKTYRVFGRIDGDRVGVNLIRIVGGAGAFAGGAYNTTTGEFEFQGLGVDPSIRITQNATLGNLSSQIAVISVRQVL